MTDNRLKIFVAVAETRSFTKAAHRLGCTQPSVSQNIAQLEAEAGGPLVDRSGGTVSLTPKGVRLYSYALRILALYDNLSSEMSGGEALPERLELDLGDGRQAGIEVRDGKLQIDLKSANN